MIDVLNKKCKCGKAHPTYNFEGETKAVCCSKCKEVGMVNVVSKKCKCGKARPTYNFEGETKPVCCSSCKEVGMVDIKHHKCKCGKSRPTYNFEGETTAVCCSKCKDVSMVNVVSKKCRCGKAQPTYNFEGETKPVCCSNCIEPGMVNVKDKKCQYPNCKVRPQYGIPKNLPSRCTTHKDEGMISNPRAKCLKRTCKDIAEYGVNRPIHCELHKNDNDINLVERRCVKCGKIDVLTRGDICVNFCSKEEDDVMYKKRQKLKESLVYNYLQENIKDIQPSLFDKTVPNDCDIRNRPDIVYEVKTHVVVVEIDEGQHKGYCPEGEVNRMKNIYTAYGGEMPVVFVRYNPDNFRISGNVVKIPIEKRLDIMSRWVRKAIDQVSESAISIVYLYYDNYNEKQRDFINIDPYEPLQECDDCGVKSFNGVGHTCL